MSIESLEQLRGEQERILAPFEPRGWKLAGILVPLAYIGWSVRLLALGVGLLITA